ncbi:MAG: hypothetical protein HQL57_09930 [Magnetococcales bacterium]|nr:hypothetical protein [Magnetococcales bacterium]
MSGRRRWYWDKGEQSWVERKLPGLTPVLAPAVRSDYAPYDCPITGQVIEGRRAHRENLARHGCRLLEAGESRDCGKRVEASYNEALSRILDG